MRAKAFILALALAPGFGACHRSSRSLSVVTPSFAAATVASGTKKPNFETEIKPIFQTRCQPCHFAGGKVYDRLPFDKPDTITRLGTKIFTRIKDEKEQRLIREFLAP